MAFIIKPLVTEKLTKITDKSSQDRTLVAATEKIAKAKNAVAEEVTYTVKKKNKPDVQKTKTVFKYQKPGQAQYGFIVRPEANRIQIKEEVEKTYNVKVLSVNTAKYAGKRSARYTKAGLVKGQKPAYKKAYVTLKAGDQIDFYSNI